MCRVSFLNHSGPGKGAPGRIRQLLPRPPCRSIESPNLGFSTETTLPHVLEDDFGHFSDLEPEPDAQNWQHTIGRDVVAFLPQREVDRQEVINGEESHQTLLGGGVAG